MDKKKKKKFPKVFSRVERWGSSLVSGKYKSQREDSKKKKKRKIVIVIGVSRTSVCSSYLRHCFLVDFRAPVGGGG